jgi:hypothetical protein
MDSPPLLSPVSAPAAAPARGGFDAPAPRRGTMRSLAAIAASLGALVAGESAARRHAGGKLPARALEGAIAVQVRKGNVATVLVNAAFGSTTACAAGEVAIGGGAQLIGGNFSNCYISESFPLDAQHWHVIVACAAGSGGTPAGTKYIPSVVCLGEAADPDVHRANA